jgi:hypothetical protein
MALKNITGQRSQISQEMAFGHYNLHISHLCKHLRQQDPINVFLYLVYFGVFKQISIETDKV